VGFEPTIPVFERAKTVHALDRAATVIGHWSTAALILSTFNSDLFTRILHFLNTSLSVTVSTILHEVTRPL
jgi:hypothetical protein